MDFKENLRAELEFRGMPLKELAERSGVNRNTLANYTMERNSAPSLENAVKIARALGVTVEYLATGSVAERGAADAVPPRLRKICDDLNSLDETDFNAVRSLIDALKARYPERGPRFGREAFLAKLDEIFARAAAEGRTCVEIEAGDLHRLVGGYPGRNHRMPVCCKAMRDAMREGDETVRSPPSGNGASLAVRYRIPR